MMGEVIANLIQLAILASIFYTFFAIYQGNQVSHKITKSPEGQMAENTAPHCTLELIYLICVYTIHIYSGITGGRVLDGEFYN